MILNLTQHQATPAQINAGVVDLPADRRAKLEQLLTVEKEVLIASPETRDTVLRSRVESILALVFDELAQWRRDQTEKAAELFANGERIAAWSVATTYIGQAMIGGAPYLTERLAKRLKELDVEPLYAASERASVEQTMSDGTVRKVVSFAHLGFIPSVA
ncbi:MAG: hypothetical protein EOM25_14525 [Deltaproteobacteria bacterium]|nr:hypothetical protein [Deltaproteobacteria bacterium]